MEKAHLRSGREQVLTLSRRGNEWMQENKLDNTLLGLLTFSNEEFILTLKYLS